jgi:hypothetical protein
MPSSSTPSSQHQSDYKGAPAAETTSVERIGEEQPDEAGPSSRAQSQTAASNPVLERPLSAFVGPVRSILKGGPLARQQLSSGDLTPTVKRQLSWQDVQGQGALAITHS